MYQARVRAYQEWIWDNREVSTATEALQNAVKLLIETPEAGLAQVMANQHTVADDWEPLDLKIWKRKSGIVWLPPHNEEGDRYGDAPGFGYWCVGSRSDGQWDCEYVEQDEDLEETGSIYLGRFPSEREAMRAAVEYERARYANRATMHRA